MKISKFIDAWTKILSDLHLKFKTYIDNRSLKSLLFDYANVIKQEVSIFKQKLKNLRQTNYNLGVMHYENGNLSDAIFRFKVLKYFCSDIKDLNYLIAKCYIEKNQYFKAKPYIEEYLDSSDTKYIDEAKYCNNLINSRFEKINEIPLNIIQRKFNLIADSYNELFINQPTTFQETIYKFISSHLTEVGSPYGNYVLDLGCGTGYISQLLSKNKSASSIIGIDISQAMLNICHNLRTDATLCYDQLLLQNVDTYLNEPKNLSYNVVIASGLLSYYPNAEKLISSSYNLLKSNGCLALSFKTNDQQSDRIFSSRHEEFHYRSGFIEELAMKYNFFIKTFYEMKFLDGDMIRIMLLIKE